MESPRTALLPDPEVSSELDIRWLLPAMKRHWDAPCASVSQRATVRQDGVMRSEACHYGTANKYAEYR